MTGLREHPRFPYSMPRDIQRAIVDQVTVTLSAYPDRQHFGSLEHAITAYAEQLDQFDLLDIEQGFRAARVEATVLAPTPSQVRVCVALVWRSRQAPPRDEKPGDAFVLGEFPAELHEFHTRRLDAPPQYLEPVEQR